MEKLTNKEFIEFIESFKGKSHHEKDNSGMIKTFKFYDTITELSKSDTRKGDSLINNSFKMYSLDNIVKGSKKFSKDNQPSSVDALMYKTNDNDDLTLFIIEFKFLGKLTDADRFKFIYDEIYNKNTKYKFSKKFLKNLKRVKKNYKDSVEFSLHLKPFETLFVALPLIYEEYCEINALQKKDMTAYLNSIDIQFWVFLGNNSNNKSNIAVISNKLNKPYTRLEKSILKKSKCQTKKLF